LLSTIFDYEDYKDIQILNTLYPVEFLFLFQNPQPKDSFFAATRPFKGKVWLFIFLTISLMIATLLIFNQVGIEYLQKLKRNSM